MASPIDSAQPTMAHDADTDSDRAGEPPAMWHTRVPVTRSEATVERWMGAARTTRRSRRSGPAEDRAQPAEGLEQEDRGGIRADDVYPECWRSIH